MKPAAPSETWKRRADRMIFRKSDIPGEDIRRAMEMTAKRRQLIDETPAAPLVCEYGVNRLAKALHPGFVRARITDKTECGTDCVRISLEPASGWEFPYFRAGQFVTLSGRSGGSFLSRPYSIVSSPKDALSGKLEVMVQKKGVFSAFLIDEAGIGSELLAGEPSGDFHHDSIRDGSHILAVAGGSGVTPFLSMMKAICEGSEDFRLTLVYGARTKAQIPFDAYDFSDERINIITVLSEEEAEGYLHGFITAGLLKDHIDGNTSVFMCGPDAMYRFVGKELESLGFDPSKIRRERNSVGDRTVAERRVFRLTARIRDEVYTVDASNEETLITALERAGIPAVVRCRNGVCGFCHSRVVSGEYFVAKENDFRRAADRKFNYIHPCSTYPESDMEIDIPIFNG